MTVYIIEGDKVATLAAAPKKAPKGAIPIGSLKDLETSKLPLPRLVALRNGLPGAKRIDTFKDRKTAVRKLWAELVRTAKQSKSKDQPQRAARSTSKQAKIIVMLRRPGGATIDEMAADTGWQRHSVRGVISGAIKKRLGLAVSSLKEKRGRVYRISDQRSAKRA